VPVEPVAVEPVAVEGATIVDIVDVVRITGRPS
jgi:hypothetical protein